VQGASLVFRQVVTLVVGDELDDHAFGQLCWFVENQASVFNACS
jgi:hypothetical protein